MKTKLYFVKFYGYQLPADAVPTTKTEAIRQAREAAAEDLKEAKARKPLGRWKTRRYGDTWKVEGPQGFNLWSAVSVIPA